MNNIEAYYKGALLGLVFIMSFGPVFFALIETSLEKGFWFAACIALGTVMSDAAYIALSKFGLSQFLGNEEFEYWLGISGGVLLIFLSGIYFFKKPTIIEFDDHNGPQFKGMEKADVRMAKPLPITFSKMTYLAYVVKGFLINTLNPFILIFWLGTAGVIAANKEYEPSDELLFFSGTLSSIFFFDVLKGFLASRLQTFINYRRMLWMNRIAGGVMLYFGLRMLVKTLMA